MRNEVTFLVKRFEEANTLPGRLEAIQMLNSFQLKRAEVNILAKHPLSDIRCLVAHSPLLSAKNVSVLSLDDNSIVRAILAGNSKITSRKILSRLSKDNDQKVRRAMAERRPLAEKMLVNLAQDPDPLVRSTIAKNNSRALPEDIVYALYASETGLPSANQALAQEIENNSNYWYLAEGDFSTPSGVILKSFCWRAKGEASWTVWGRDVRDGELGVTKLILPQNIDGFFRLFTNGEQLVITGRAIRAGSDQDIIWACGGKKQKNLYSSFPLLQFRYPNKSFEKGKTFEANLLGQVLYNLNVFALWEVDGVPVGWTKEASAKECGTKRKLSKEDLLPDYFEEFFNKLENDYRKVVHYEMGL